MLEEKKPWWGAREWKAAVIGLGGVVLGYFLIHLWNDHQGLHRIFEMVNQAQRQSAPAPTSK